MMLMSNILMLVHRGIPSALNCIMDEGSPSALKVFDCKFMVPPPLECSFTVSDKCLIIFNDYWRLLTIVS